MRVAEIQIIRGADRCGSAAGEITRALGYRGLGAFVGIQIHMRRVAIYCQCHKFLGELLTIIATGHTVGLDPNHGGVAAGIHHRVGAHHVIILAIDPVLGGNAGPFEQLLQCLCGIIQIVDALQRVAAHIGKVSRFTRFAMINGRVISKLAGRQIGHHFAVIFYHHLAGIGHKTDLRPRQIPFIEDPFHLFLAPLGHDDEHALLRFAQQHLVRCHAGAALRHLGQINLNPRAAACRGFASGTSEPGGTHVLNAGHGAGGQQFEAGFHAKLFHERITHLHRAALLFGRFFSQILRRERGPSQAIAAGGRAHVKNGIPHALGGTTRDLVMTQHAQRKGVHQRIPLVALVEINFTRHGRNTEAVAVMRNSAHHTTEKPPDFTVIELPESEGVDRANRTRAHGKDIPNDPAHSGGRTLKRLHGAGVIMALDFE